MHKIRPQTYSFQFQELDISVASIEKFIGYEIGGAPEPVAQLIEDTLQIAADLCDLKGGYVIIEDIEIDRKNGKITLNDVEFEVDKIIASQLRKSESGVLFMCTAGPGIGKYSKELMAKGDLLEGYIADAVGSETVEAAIEIMQGHLEQELKMSGINITDRYSPGYCGWSVAEQHKLFSFFPEEYCGITINSYALMDPIKSVSGIIGIGKEVSRKGYACNYCKIPNCIYRKLEYHDQTI